MTKRLKFSQLSLDAKINAAQEYIDGFEETNDEETMSLDEAIQLCKDIEDDVLYSEDGVECFDA